MAFFVEELKRAMAPINESKECTCGKCPACLKKKEKVEEDFGVEKPQQVKIDQNNPVREDNTSEPVEESVELTEMQRHKKETGRRFDTRFGMTGPDKSRELGYDKGSYGYDHQSYNIPSFDDLSDAQTDILDMKMNKRQSKELDNAVVERPMLKDIVDKDKRILNDKNKAILDKHRARRGKNESVKRVSAMSLLKEALKNEL